MPSTQACTTTGTSTDTCTSTAAHFSLNAFRGCHGADVEHPLYQAHLAYMGVRSLRIHSWNMLKDARAHHGGWLDVAHKRWDREAVARCCEAWQHYTGELIINIPGWPVWLQQRGDVLAPAHWDDTAAWYAELVDLVVNTHGLQVAWWEATNEFDQGWIVAPRARGEADHAADMAALYTRCSRAMRAAGATQVGGPAFTRPDQLDNVAGFIDTCREHCDVLSVHAYGCGSADTPDRDLFARPAVIAASLADIRAMLNQRGLHDLPLHLNEFNVAWTWDSLDPRMPDHRGACFDAAMACCCIPSGVQAMMAWNECDGVYGKMDGAYRLRPAGHWYHLANRHCIGEWTTLPSADGLHAAQVAGDARTSLVLVNTTDQVASAPKAADSASGAEYWRIDENGFTRLGPAASAGWKLLPRHSITVAVW
ncbi:MAG: hypothetical protein PF961_07885 [Planctomycetota bacterium]|jgi:hypothetical protein|nr:hypothetical protein [Planctomycetota bacterium]